MSQIQSDPFTYHAVHVPSVFRRAGFFSAKAPSYRLGPGGLQVNADVSFTTGAKLELEMFVSGNESVSCLTRVAWSERNLAAGGSGFRLGLQILRINGFDESLVWRAVGAKKPRELPSTRTPSREFATALPAWNAATAILFPES